MVKDAETSAAVTCGSWPWGERACILSGGDNVTYWPWDESRGWFKGCHGDVVTERRPGSREGRRRLTRPACKNHMVVKWTHTRDELRDEWRVVLYMMWWFPWCSQKVWTLIHAPCFVFLLFISHSAALLKEGVNFYIFHLDWQLTRTLGRSGSEEDVNT